MFGKDRIRNQPDLLAALLFGLSGLAGLILGWPLASGTAAAMGSGYFPKLVSWLLIAAAVALVVRSLIGTPEKITLVRVRPIVFIVIAALLFAFLLERIGLAVTAFVTIVVATFAARDISHVQRVILALVLSTASVVLFVYALQQPLSVWGPR